MKLLNLAALVFLGTAPAVADTAVPLTVSGQQATAVVNLLGGLGIELEIGFEGVVGLNPGALDVSVRLVSPLDPILPRLAAAGGLLPAALPLVIRIEPAQGSGMSFQGITTLSLHTENLVLNTLLPLSLFSSSGGEPFRDVTRSEGIGSYRVGGSTGGFSEFVIVLDQRNINTVITGKFNAITALLDTHADRIAPDTLSALQARLASARSLYNAMKKTAAAAEVGLFAEEVRAQSGTAIPDVWRANDPSVVNVAGALRGAALTLKFSISRKPGLLGGLLP